MGVIRQRVTQSAADTATAVQLPLVALDGKSGYEIKGMEVLLTNGVSLPASDWQINAKLLTANGTYTFSDDEVICEIDWGFANVAGVAIGNMIEIQKEKFLMESRITVQPQIFVQLSSVVTGLVMVADFRVYYDLVKLTELEYLRMLTGGA
jgi:hypothetical protein